jgi:transposase InsO family protein
MGIPSIDRPKTAFSCSFGLFQFKRLPMGLKNSPAIFQHYINVAMHGLLHKSVLAYVDDLLIFSKTFEDHIQHLKEFSDRLLQFGLRVNPKKCQFFADKVTFLGHEISSRGVSPSSQHKDAIRDISRPRTLKQLRAFIGMCSFFRRFVKGFTEIAYPLQKIVNQQRFREEDWTDSQEESFRKLKDILTGDDVFLAHPDFGQRFKLVTDASDHGIGGTLLQNNRPVAFLSRTLRKAEIQLPPAHKEALAAVWCCDKLRPFLIGREFDLIGDNHPLVSALDPKSKSRRLTFWAWKLQDYSFKFKHRSGTSPEMQIADGLSRLPRDSQSAQVDVMLAEDISQTITLPHISWAMQYKDGEMRRLPKKLLSKDKEGRMLVKGRLYVPLSVRTQLLHYLHEKYAHIGSTKLYGILLKHYYWNQMKRDVVQFIRQCLSCQCAKAPRCHFGFLRPFRAGLPWDTLHIDVVGPFRIGDTEFYLITAVDSFGGWAEAKALRYHPTSADIVAFLISEIIARHGVPKRLVCDNGRILTSEVAKLFHTEVGIKLATTSIYHPQANGKVERFHRFLKETLRASTITSPKDFIAKLPWVLFAYRTTYHEGIREIPFFVYHGFDARMPIMLRDDSTPQILDNSFQSAARYHAYQVRKHLAAVKEYIAQESSINMQKMKKLYDGPRSDHRFREGDYVLLWDHRKRKNLKMSKSLLLRWRGPFRVLQVLSSTNYKLQYVFDEGVVVDSHVLHMRPFDGSKFQGRKKDEPLSELESTALTQATASRNESSREILGNELPLLRRSSRIAAQANKGQI